MKNIFKIFGKRSVMLLTLCLMVVTSACKNDGNPWNIPDAEPAQYGGNSNDGVIKILAIGNSFSENAIESNLYELAKESGKTVIIGNLYIGGASLADHKANIEKNAPVYNYRRIGADGVKRTHDQVSIERALEDEPWDYISFQQASPNSGQLETVQASLPTIFNYVKAKAKNPNVKYIYHQTWAYSPITKHDGFANYNKDQTTMYNAIVNVAKNVKSIVPIGIVVPAGTAIQDARTSLLGDSFTAGDGYHLNELGKYIAACTWFEQLFGASTVGMKHRPAGISNFEVKVAQNAAHLAVQKPYEVSSMADYQVDPAPLAKSVLVSFGNGDVSPSWNQMSSFVEGAQINLKDSVNAFVGIALTIKDRFTGINTGGEKVTTTPLNMPENVSSKSFYGQNTGAKSSFVLSNLDKTITYNFCFFGSRGGTTENRETEYTATGTNSSFAKLNPSSNKASVVCVQNIKPDADGKITITVKAGSNNANSSKFYYLNAVKITSN